MPAGVIVAGQKPRSKLDYLLGGLSEGIQQRKEAQVLSDILGAPSQRMGQDGMTIPGFAGGQMQTAPMGQGNIRYENGFPATGPQQATERTAEQIVSDRTARLNDLKAKAQRVMTDPRLTPDAKQRAIQLLDMQFQFESQQQALEDQQYALSKDKKASEAERVKSTVVSKVMGALPADADARDVFQALTAEGLSVEESLKIAGKFTKDANGNSKAITLNNQVGNVLSRMKAQISNIQKEISVQDAYGNMVMDFSGEKGRAAKARIDKITKDAFKAVKRLYEKEGLEVPSDVQAALADFEAAGKAQEQERAINDAKRDAELDQIMGLGL